MALVFPMTVRNVFDDLLLLMGVETANNAPMYIRERVLTDINATLQFIQSAGGDFFAREIAGQSLSEGVSSYALSNEIQSVLGPLRLESGRLLREFATRGEFDLFSQVALGQTEAAEAEPLAYFLQRLRDTTPTDGDNVALTLLVAPTPDAAYSLTMEVVKRPASFVYADLTNSAKIIPIAHQYCHSIFLPIARYNVATSPWFFYRETLPAIQMDYRRALALLGVTDPAFLTEDEGDAKRTAAQMPAPPPQPAPQVTT